MYLLNPYPMLPLPPALSPLVTTLSLLFFLLEKGRSCRRLPPDFPDGHGQFGPFAMLCYRRAKRPFDPESEVYPLWSHPVGYLCGTRHILSVWLPGSLTTWFPWSGLSISRCHKWQDCEEDSGDNRWDLIPPRSHCTPQPQVNSQQRSRGGLAFKSQGKKQSLLAAEETAPLGTNYSILRCPYCSGLLPAPLGDALLGFPIGGQAGATDTSCSSCQNCC